jgi:hypothetical protein
MGDGLDEYDISEEAYREVILPSGFVYQIEDPKTLYMRRGGTTHRVVDANGVTHCYPSPSEGTSIIRWKRRDGKPPVRF